MNGIIVVNKPKGITSYDVVRIIKRLTGVKKVGHGGTLDPIAEGVLPIFLGNATRKASFFLEGDKGYFGEMVIGIRTDTFDADGKILNVNKVLCKKDEMFDKIKNVFSKFEGEMLQIPPMFSAKHFRGKRLYELARKGRVVEREPKRVKIYKLEFLDYEHSEHPRVKFGLYCSKGTYVRALVSDIGDILGYGAHLSSLVRTYSHPFVLSQAVSIETVANLAKIGKISDILIDADELLEVLSNP